MSKIRLKYLLMRSFKSTVQQWRHDPEGLKAEINAHLKRAAEYRARDAPDPVMYEHGRKFDRENSSIRLFTCRSFFFNSFLKKPNAVPI